MHLIFKGSEELLLNWFCGKIVYTLMLSAQNFCHGPFSFKMTELNQTSSEPITTKQPEDEPPNNRIIGTLRC